MQCLRITRVCLPYKIIFFGGECCGIDTPGHRPQQLARLPASDGCGGARVGRPLGFVAWRDGSGGGASVLLLAAGGGWRNRACLRPHRRSMNIPAARAMSATSSPPAWAASAQHGDELRYGTVFPAHRNARNVPGAEALGGAMVRGSGRSVTQAPAEAPAVRHDPAVRGVPAVGRVPATGSAPVPTPIPGICRPAPSAPAPASQQPTAASGHRRG